MKVNKVDSKFFKFVLFSNIYVPRKYPVSLLFVDLLGTADKM